MNMKDRIMHTLLRHSRGFVAAALVLVTACNAESGPSDTVAALDSDDQKASYGIGHSVGQGLAPMAERIDIAALTRGFQDALIEAEPAIPADELQSIMQAFQMEMMQADQLAKAEQAEAGSAEAELFMARNGAREGVTTTESGLQYEILNQGTGPLPGPEARVTVHYRGTLADGTQFDSSYDRGEPATFGMQGVIAGFSEGLQLMPVGSKYMLFIPPDIGYGPQGSGPIPPSSALIFELEMLAIE
jgi:FKBP-type peptidyl-prolyl cis-trans isomerase